MAEYSNLGDLFTDIADAIRDKTGSTEAIQAEAFPKAISGITTGDKSDTSATSIIMRTVTEYNDEAHEVEYIGDSAFHSCAVLEDINFPVCSWIGQWAFYYCTDLKTASFGACTSIASYAFRNCTSLESLYMMGDEIPTLGTYVFSSTPMSSSSYLGHHGSIYVPESMLDDYKKASGWSAFSNRFVGV